MTAIKLSPKQDVILKNSWLGIVYALPALSLTTKGWVNTCFFALCFLSILTLVKSPKKTQSDNFLTKEILLISLALSSLFLSILISQLFRRELIFKEYDAPLRLLLGIPIFLATIIYSPSLKKILTYSLSSSICAIFIYLEFFPRSGFATAPNRISSPLMDPIFFGGLTLTFCLLILFALQKPFTSKRNIFFLLICSIGVGLSIGSGSRGPWASAILTLFFLSLFFLRTLVQKISLIGITLLASVLLFTFNPKIQERIALAQSEVTSYKWHEVNPNTSVGLRISFLRMGVYLFSLKPLSGWGDQGFKGNLYDKELMKFMTPQETEQGWGGGLNSDLISHPVRAGVWGLMAISFLMILPIYYSLKSRNDVHKRSVAIISFIYFFSMLIQSLSTEIFTMKFMASFHSYFIALFLGTLIASNANSKENITKQT